MTFAILSILVLVGGIGALAVYNKNKAGKAVRGNLILPVIVAALVFSGSMFTVVPANSVGIVYSPFVGVLEETLPEGMHVKGPFDAVYTLSTEVQTHSIQNITGQTKDSQYITMEIDVKYCVDTAEGMKVFKQYRSLNNVAANLISSTVQRSIESVTTQYNIIEVLGEKRNEIYTLIEKELTERLAASSITFVSINFVDTDAGDAIEQAIQAEAIAKKAVETAEQERLKAEIEAQTVLIEAQAEADANRIISESITPELLQKMEMEARLEHGWITVYGGSVVTVPDTTK